MAKGRKPAPRRGASRAQAAPRRALPGWAWLLGGLIIGVFATLLLQLEPGNQSVQRDRTPPRPAVQPAQPNPPPRSETRYEFYTLLPESEVMVPESAVPEKPASTAETRDDETSESSAPAPSDTRFFLQAGSFRQQSDADRVRAQILLLGLSVQLEPARLNDGDTWYRVQVGPFHDREKLNQAQSMLAGNGFDNLLLQRRNANQ
ncbi:SPOR domain-containing protein [Halopseudomonas salegens]|uniref:Cell division protein FtsN n=1 Tax=Halopseudomonas salegens TaxID=1434072 RepID=A0A1H2H7M9_9GAMM|nr:SPOR domain-containing protein [Halopseudomonas salegens]SDU27834.1 Cell division protein FtsN [Halopseudomonas salegens]